MTVASVSPDFVTIATNVGVFLAASGTVIVAIWSAAKKIKSVLPDNGTATKMVGGAILDTSSILMWSESNREVAETNRDLTREMMELRFAITRLVDKKG